MSEDRSKEKAKKWKSKAIIRGHENNALRKRNREVLESRDHWRSKYYSLKGEETLSRGSRAHGYHYSVLLVRLCVLCQSYGGTSLRSCRHCISQLIVVLHLDCRVPSVSTIRNWVIKCGYYQVEGRDRSKGKWVVWVDESTFLGGEQLLLVLGINESCWSHDRAVTMGDVSVVAVRSRASWNTDQVAEVLRELQQRIKIIYGISDRASVLRAAFTVTEIPYVSDCTHVVANILEKEYKKDASFIAFSAWASGLRAKWAMSKANAPYMPPAQRTQARFANVFPVVKWACQILKMKRLNLMGLPKGVRDELLKLQQYKSLLLDLEALYFACRYIFKILKNIGLCKLGYKTIIKKKTNRKTPKVLSFYQQIGLYLKELKPLVTKYGIILCCSDVIESAFGKFKLKVNAKSTNGLTNFTYSIANYGQSFSNEDIKLALEKTKQKDIQKEIPHTKTTRQIRREFFSKNRGKSHRKE